MQNGISLKFVSYGTLGTEYFQLFYFLFPTPLCHQMRGRKPTRDTTIVLSLNIVGDDVAGTGNLASGSTEEI